MKANKRWFAVMGAIGAFCAVVLPGPARAGDKGVVAPPFASAFTSEASTGLDRCEASTDGRFVAIQSGSLYNSCLAGGEIEVTIPREATVTINLHVNEVIGQPDPYQHQPTNPTNPDRCGIQECPPTGPSMCVRTKWTDETLWHSCKTLDAMSNQDISISFPYVGGGNGGSPSTYLRVIARAETGYLAQRAAVDVVVTSVSIDY